MGAGHIIRLVYGEIIPSGHPAINEDLYVALDRLDVPARLGVDEVRGVYIGVVVSGTSGDVERENELWGPYTLDGLEVECGPAIERAQEAWRKIRAAALQCGLELPTFGRLLVVGEYD